MRNPALWIAVISALTSVMVGYLTFKANTRATQAAEAAARNTNRVEERKVDQTAFDKAQSAYDATLQWYEKQMDRLTGQVDRLNSQLERMSAQLASEQDTSNSLRDQVRALQQQVALMSQTIEQLRNGMPPIKAPPGVKEGTNGVV